MIVEKDPWEYVDVRVLYFEHIELQMKYKEVLDRLHQCKRRNREDKVRLRNHIGKLDEIINGRYVLNGKKAGMALRELFASIDSGR